MEKSCPECNKGILNYNLYEMPDYNSVEIIKEKFGITTNIKGCEPPLANQKNYLYSCISCNYETGDLDVFDKIELEFVIGGYSSGIQRILWDGSFLCLYITNRGYEDLKSNYGSYPDNTPLDVSISDQSDWNKFWKVMDEINVWKWNKDYWTDICDGTQWELLIKTKGRRKRRIFGSNDYPKEDNNLSKLQAAMNRLVGIDFFNIDDE